MLAQLFSIEGNPNAGVEYHWLCGIPAAAPAPVAAMGQSVPTA
jgi:hypothetical protein